MSKSAVNELLDVYIKEVNNLIMEQLNSPVDLVNNICGHLIISGGKRIRPRLLLLTSEMLKPGSIADKQIQEQAAALEIIHTATLLHDDVIDESTMRRGNPSTNQIYGNTLAVLGGDFLFTKAFKLSVKNTKIGTMFTQALSTLVQGEIEQMSNIADTKLQEQSYFHTIYSKTSVLFECSTQIPAIYLDIEPDSVEKLKKFGCCIGNAFQIADDILDYTSDSQSLGKNIGDDLSEEKITLPLIYTFESISNLEKKELEEAIKANDICAVMRYVKQTNAIEKCYQRAKQEVDTAITLLKDFPNNECRDALIDLAQSAITRKS
jgi:octaprenyl-diphosphate synthase